MGATIDQCVNSIIEHRAPVLPGRVTLSVLESVLVYLEARIGDDTELAFLKELRPYDFPGTDNIWNTETGKNYVLARELSHLVVQKLMVNNHWTFIELVQKVTQKPFNDTIINKWGTTASGMAIRMYRSHIDAIIDLVMNDRRYAEWCDVKHYDFKKTKKRTDAETREMTHTLLQKIMDENKWDFVQLIRNMRNPSEDCGYTGWKHAFQKPMNRYGTTLMGVLDRYRDCPSETVLDLVMSDERYEEFRDLSKPDFPDQRNIWNLKDRRKNYELARKMTDALMTKLNLQDCTLPEILARMSDKTFFTTEINRYGTKLYGMVKRTYGSSVRKAIEDWYAYGRETSVKLV